MSEQPQKPKLSRRAFFILLFGLPLFFVLVVEFGLHMVGYQPMFDGHWKMLSASTPADARVELVEHPKFITDEDGFWVAAPEVPGTYRGFRTPTFDSPKDKRPRVLFLGDSFTWGKTAEPLSESFVDRVQAAGYDTVNLGIPGTGPAQYVAGAEKHLANLHPDATCVMLYLGDDLRPEPAIAPGLPRFYETNVALLSAFDLKGEPVTLDEAAHTYLGYFGHDWDAKLRRTVYRSTVATLVTQAWLIASEQYDQNQQLAVERLARIRALAEENGSRFFLFLIPTRAEYSAEKTSVELIEKMLAEFSPRAIPPMASDHYAPLPDAHYNNLGHAKCSEVLLAALEHAGLKGRPDTPEAQVAAEWRKTFDSWTFAQFKRELRLNDSQAESILQLLNKKKDDFAELMFRRPSGLEPSPGEYLAMNSGVEGGSTSEAFDQYCASKVDPVSGQSYRAMVGSLYERQLAELMAALDPQQQKILLAIPPATLTRIDTGHDPFGNHINKISPAGMAMGSDVPPIERRNNIELEEFATHLTLDATQTEQVREIVNGAKQDFADICSRPAEVGASPVELLRVLLQDATVDEAARDASFGDALQSGIAAETGKTYGELLQEALNKRMEALSAVLSAAQRSQLASVPVDSLLKINTGSDPFGALVSRGGDGKSNWESIAQALKLDAELAQKIESEINGLKRERLALLQKPAAEDKQSPLDFLRDQLAADNDGAQAALADYLRNTRERESGQDYAELLEAQELTVRREIAAQLNFSQRRRFQELVTGSLADINTGEDPVGEALGRPE